MRGATAATLPPAMATSRTALMLLRGSIKWPPRRRTSYFGSAARASPPRPATSSSGVSGAAQARMRSGPPAHAPLGRPAGAEVLAHVERPRHLVAGHLAGERVRDRVAGLLPERAADPHRVSVDRSRQI